MLVQKEGGVAHLPDPMISIMNAVQADPDWLMFFCLGLEVEAGNSSVFQYMMYGTKNLLRLDDKHVKQLTTVAHKPDRGVAKIPVANLAEWNFKLIVYYVKLCELRIRPVVLAVIDGNALKRIEYYLNHLALHNNMEKYLPVITQSQITKKIDIVWDIVNEHL